ncbi:hypothetical protein [Dankookia rubra]|uniref:hypothetical protein n=1 Tax=Dankookia rubra TaxID=1442381 RepID=UPI001F4F118E|nr:hypothetical protein [Dankookia rubra]
MPNPPSGVPNIPSALPASAQRVETPTDPRHLPEWAQGGWKGPDRARPNPNQGTPQPPRGQDPIGEAIIETRDGVQNLQVLLDTPDGPSKTEQIVQLLEELSTANYRMLTRQEELEQKLDQLLRAITTLAQTGGGTRRGIMG